MHWRSQSFFQATINAFVGAEILCHLLFCSKCSIPTCAWSCRQALKGRIQASIPGEIVPFRIGNPQGAWPTFSPRHPQGVKVPAAHCGQGGGVRHRGLGRGSPLRMRSRHPRKNCWRRSCKRPPTCRISINGWKQTSRQGTPLASLLLSCLLEGSLKCIEA